MNSAERAASASRAGQSPGSAPTPKLMCLGDLAYLLGGMVPRQWMYALTRLQGRVQAHARSRARAAVETNFRLTFEPKLSAEDIKRMTRQYFESRQLRRLLVYLFPRLRPAEKERLFPIEGLGRLDAALAQGKGAVLVGSHLHSIVTLLMKGLLREKGYDARVALPVPVVPYAPTRFHKMLDRGSGKGLWDDPRGHFYAQFNIRPIVRALKENAAVILMGDGWHSASFVKAKFLRQTVDFTTGPMGVVRFTEVPAIPFFVTGVPPDKLTISLEEPIALIKTNDPERDLTTMVGDYVQRLETHLLHNIPAWEHWIEDRALEQMATILEKPLAERYKL